jgi:hypothetical protein
MRGGAVGRLDHLKWLAWVTAGIAWAALVVLLGLAGDAENGAERFGRFIGVALVTFAPALLLRWLYTKAGGGSVWSPWVLVIAALAALVAGAGSWRDSGEAAAPLPEVNLTDLIGEAPEGYRYVETPPVERRQARRMLALQGANGFFMRDVVRRGRLAAFVMVVTTDVDVVEEDVRQGLEAGMGSSSRSMTIGNERIFATISPNGRRMLVRSDRRAVVMLVVLRPFPARNLARAILTG